MTYYLICAALVSAVNLNNIVSSLRIVKLNDLQAALDQFKSCLDMAKQQEDKPAELAISNAIEDVNEHMQGEERRTAASEGTKEEERQQEENRKEKSPGECL